MSVLFALALLSLGRSHAAWLSVEIGQHDRRAMCAASGRLGAGPALIVCGENGPFFEYRWRDDEWRVRTAPSGLSYPTAGAIFSAGNVDRLILGSRLASKLVEHQYSETGVFKTRDRKIPGHGTYRLSVGASVSPGQAVLVAERHSSTTDTRDGDLRCLTPIVTQSMKLRYMHRRNLACRHDGENLSCEELLDRCPESATVSPLQWGLDYDLILANRVYKAAGAGWKSSAEYKWKMNQQPSLLTARRLYTDDLVLDFRMDFSSALVRSNGSPFIGAAGIDYAPRVKQVHGGYRALAVSLAESKNTEALIAADDEYLYKIVETSAGWERKIIRKLDGEVEAIAAGPLRGDGVERIYIVENIWYQPRSRVLELTYVPRPPRVSVGRLMASQGPGTATANDILSEAIERTLTNSGAVRVIEEEQKGEVVSERRVNVSLCSDERCRSRYAQDQAADFILVPLARGRETPEKLELQVYKPDGALFATFGLPYDPNVGLVGGAEKCAEKFLLALSKAPRL